jgi:hypothetical protein
MAIDINKLAEIGTMAAGGGYAQAALGGAQAVYGLTQLPKAKAEFERAKAAAPSLETPAQFYENYKNAYDGEMARMQNDVIQSNLATSIQALQGAGGRALVGGLNQATAQSQSAQNSMLAQERQMRMAAGQQLASAEERTVGRKEARSQQEQAYANQAYQAALGNIGSGLGAAGEGLMYGLSAAKGNNSAGVSETSGLEQKPLEQKPQEGKPETASPDFVSESRKMIGDAKKPGILNTPDLNLQDPTAMLIGAGTVGKSAPKLPDLQYNQPSGLNNQEPEKAGSIYDYPAAKGSAIPVQYRNTQAMKQIQALGKAYSAFKPFVDSMGKFRNGGMLTDGAFDHASNPIDLVQNGQVVGEATGGEYILNPEQAAAIAKQSAFAKNLFKKFEKNAKKKK